MLAGTRLRNALLIWRASAASCSDGDVTVAVAVVCVILMLRMTTEVEVLFTPQSPIPLRLDLRTSRIAIATCGYGIAC